ncbi:MAG: hypothetical protein DSY34_04345 [Desulfurobacterium sp.]|nr:MAG: hypothetical protein DSY34_04345 [Desulfurobacterium sp.]
MENQTDNCPVNWISENKTLVIKYVDYDKDGCKNETFEKNDKCSYKVVFSLKDNNLKRGRDMGDNETLGEVKTFPMFDENLIEVENFTVSINDSFTGLTILSKVKSGWE